MRMRGMNKMKKLSYLYEPLISAACAFSVILVIIGIFSFLITKLDAKDIMLSVMSTAALAAGAYVGGYVSGRRRKRNGIFIGTMCGIFIFLIIVLLSTLFSKTVESFPVSAKLIVTLVCAAAGGVVGVNSKRR